MGCEMNVVVFVIRATLRVLKIIDCMFSTDHAYETFSAQLTVSSSLASYNEKREERIIAYVKYDKQCSPSRIMMCSEIDELRQAVRGSVRCTSVPGRTISLHRNRFRSDSRFTFMHMCHTILRKRAVASRRYWSQQFPGRIFSN